MRKALITLGIYLIFTLGGLFIISSILMILGQMGSCLGYNENHSFLSEWLNITYYEEKERYEACLKEPDTHGIFENMKEKEFSCKDGGIVETSCNRPNFKPGITYGTLGIMIIIFGFYFRRKHISKP